jgi:hypothetical protein
MDRYFCLSLLLLLDAFACLLCSSMERGEGKASRTNDAQPGNDEGGWKDDSAVVVAPV